MPPVPPVPGGCSRCASAITSSSESTSERSLVPCSGAVSCSASEVKVASTAVTKDRPVADLSAQIARRAYKLYEEGGRKEGAAAANWQTAESEIRKDLANAASAPKTKVEPMPVGEIDEHEDVAPVEAGERAKTGKEPPDKRVNAVQADSG